MGIQILLLVVGLVIIFLSITITDKYSQNKSDGDVSGTEEAMMQRIIEESKEKIRANSESILSEKVEEELHRADDELGHISNEKIMAVSDFSDQLLEKIEQNHKEVVFLYDMLNAKENEMKEFVQEIDKSKVVLEELANIELEKQKTLQHKRIQKELEKQLKKERELEKQKNDLMLSRVIPEETQEVPKEKPEQEKETRKVNKQMSALERMGGVLEEAPKEQSPVVEQVKEQKITPETIPEPTQKVSKEPEIKVEENNQNQVILDLYNEGKTIMEIAKMLGKGQGEVKLVIDLFQGAR